MGDFGEGVNLVGNVEDEGSSAWSRCGMYSSGTVREASVKARIRRLSERCVGSTEVGASAGADFRG